MQRYYIAAVNKLLTDKNGIIKTFQVAQKTVFDTTALVAERDELQSELPVVSELLQQCIHENAHVALDQDEYKKRYAGLTENTTWSKPGWKRSRRL